MHRSLAAYERDIHDIVTRMESLLTRGPDAPASNGTQPKSPKAAAALVAKAQARHAASNGHVKMDPLAHLPTTTRTVCQRVLDALQDGPKSATDVAKNLKRTAAGQYVHLRRLVKLRLVRIVGVDSDGGTLYGRADQKLPATKPTPTDSDPFGGSHGWQRKKMEKLLEVMTDPHSATDLLQLSAYDSVSGLHSALNKLQSYGLVTKNPEDRTWRRVTK